MELDEESKRKAESDVPFEKRPSHESEQLFVGRDRDETPTDALKEPGGVIPNLPVWDEPDAGFLRNHQPAQGEPIRIAPRRHTESEAVVARYLTFRTTVSLVEAAKLCEQLAYEWRAGGPVPMLEDVVTWAAARALREALDTVATIGLRRIDGGSERLSLAPAAVGNSFRRFVAELADAARGDAGADFVITSFLATAVEQADPRLATGFFALTIGAGRMVVVLEQNVPVHRRTTTLSLAYAPESVPDGVAAALLSRIRELIEAPYALLAD